MWMQPTRFRLKETHTMFGSLILFEYIFYKKKIKKNQNGGLDDQPELLTKFETYFWNQKSSKICVLMNLWSPLHSVMVYQHNVKLQTAMFIP